MTALDANPYEVGLDKNAANYVPLTPIGFLLRSAAVYPNRLAVAYGERRYSWRTALERCRRLASALAARGVRAIFPAGRASCTLHPQIHRVSGEVATTIKGSAS